MFSKMYSVKKQMKYFFSVSMVCHPNERSKARLIYMKIALLEVGIYDR